MKKIQIIKMKRIIKQKEMNRMIAVKMKNIFSKILPVSKLITLLGCNSVNYISKYYSVKSEVKDTSRTVTGCNTTYNNVFITVNHCYPVCYTVNLNSCFSLIYHNVVYKHYNSIIDILRTELLIPKGFYFLQAINVEGDKFKKIITKN